MKKYLFILLFCFVNVVYVFSQLSKNAHIESGMFVCKANQYLIYMQNEQIDSEESIYTIKALDLNNNGKLVLDRQIKNKCISMSDTSILYIKDSDLILWNLELKKKNRIL